MQENKKNKKIKQLSEADANSIFDAIENSIDFSKRED